MSESETERTPAARRVETGVAAAGAGTAVRVEELCRTFTPGGAPPLTALNRVSLDIPAGSTVALTGPSGSGKSTLLHVVGAIERADSGSVRVGTTEVTAVGRGALAVYRQSIGFVFQRFHLLPALTVLDNVLVPLLAHGARRAARRRGAARAAELIAAVGLAGREHALPSQLSGGQQQRVAIARALIAEPGLLLADEPTGNLDSANGTAVIDLLLGLNETYGTTLLIATHDPAIAACCSRAITLTDGEIRHDTAHPQP
jgi:putative ABC transport system ATP-binding protein